MEERYKTKSAAILYLLRENNGKTEVLLQKRIGHYGNGKWDGAASGHVDKDESMTTSLIREAQEEIGVGINKCDILFTNITHCRFADSVYYNGHFFVKKYTGTPSICEPEKCSALEWFNIDSLPENTLKDRKQAIKDYLNNVTFTEFGWDIEYKV